MIKAKPWKGDDLKGTWEFTLKIDGVRAFWTEDGWVSRNGKPLYNIPEPVSAGPDMPLEGFEVYCSKPGRSSKENYKATIKCVRAKTKDRPIEPSELYSLEPLDLRLFWVTAKDPTASRIRSDLRRALMWGYEGLVLREVDTERWLKVKPIETYDVKVTGIIEGTGKHKGRMGALMTPMGKVGTGFTDAEREEWWKWSDNVRLMCFEGEVANECNTRDHGGEPHDDCAGCVLVDANDEHRTIEVECMQLTPAGKFRHPRFVRIRYDK